MTYKVSYTDKMCFHEKTIDARTPMRAMRGVLDYYAEGCTIIPVCKGMDVAYWEIVRIEITELGY